MKFLFKRVDNEFDLDEKRNIIVFGIPSQHVYIMLDRCSCNGCFKIKSHFNKSPLGLSEFKTQCTKCKKGKSYIFNISNKKYQEWFNKFSSGKIDIQKELEKLLTDKKLLEKCQTKIKENNK